MNTEQARNLVRQTLTQSFDKTRFRNFVLEVLNTFDESKAFASNKTYIKDAFKNHVDRFERLGTYTSPDDEKLDVLTVHLTKESKLERARTAIRNFVADHLKQRDGKDAALVAFVSPTEKQWRFSYVKMEYATVDKDSGKVGVETKLTPARRFSYIVGEGESCHTAQTRFLDLLQDTETAPTLAQVEEAFSVEAVTKEFFVKYRARFEEIDKALQKLAKKDPAIAKEFDKKNVRTADFAKKLMGQIVFLYFIQKKGWLGVAEGKNWGTGPHDFLRRLAHGEYGNYENFFNDVLEPLFYDTLASDRGHDAWCTRFNCRIPFLNGGLFEPLADYNWRKTDIVLPNGLFTNNERFDDFSSGTGLLDMFDRYNFTVNEAEPLEKEVAIDPEMLGKVFENLIEENLRKGLGSYYTPREIVHYMCQESLINYLDTALNSATETIGREKRKQTEFSDEKSEQTLLTAHARRELVRRVDLETFVHLGDQISHYEAVETRYAITMPKSIEKHARLIDEKLADITICDPAVGSGAFPVGMMSEIVRARSALTPYFNDVHDRTPYHFKRHAIQDCLYGVDIDPGAVEIAKLRLWLSLVVDEEDVKQIKPLPNLFYKVVTGNSLRGVEKTLFNEKLFRRLEELKPRYFDEPDKDKKHRYKEDIDATIHELTNGKEEFDFEIYFSEVFHHKGGFDVVIANPPYGVSFSMDEKAFFKHTFADVHIRTPDSFNYFISKSLRLIRPHSVLAFIVPNVLLFQNEYEKTRRLILQKTLVSVTNFGDGVFSSAIVPSCVFVLINEPSRNYSYRYSDLRNNTDGATDWRNHFDMCDSSRTLQTPGAVFGVNSAAFSLLQKVFKQSLAVDDIAFEVAAGIGTGGDKVFRITKQFAKQHRFESAILQPLLVGGEIDKWVIRPSDHLLIYTNKKVNIAEFQNVFAYLKPFQKQLSQKRETRKGMLPWWCLHWPRYPGLFSGPKMVMRQTADSIRAAIDTGNYYVLNSILVLKLKPDAPISSQALLGVLNSRLNNFVYRQLTQEEGRTFAEVKPKNVRKLRVPKLGAQNQRKLETLVSRIVDTKQRNPGADASALEREIDQFVYALYDLTSEEIEIIEKGAKK